MPRFEYKDNFDIGVAIFATSRHHAPYSVTVNASDYTADADGKKVLAAGQFMCQHGSIYRFLPRGKVSTAFTAGSATGGAILDRYQNLKVGDELWILQPFGTVTFAATWLATENITLTVGTDTLTFQAGDTDVANIAAKAVAEIQSDPVMNNLVEAFSVAGVLWLFARDFETQYALNATTDSVAGTTTRSAATFTDTTKIGDISAITPGTGAITLAANAAVSAPAGTRVGPRVNRIMGIYAHSLDIGNAVAREVYVANVADIYEQSLPYIDDDIRRQCPKLVFDMRF